jgi:hypothetical protein
MGHIKKIIEVEVLLILFVYWSIILIGEGRWVSLPTKVGLSLSSHNEKHKGRSLSPQRWVSLIQKNTKVGLSHTEKHKGNTE